MLVWRKFIPFSVNFVVLLTGSSVFLAFHTSNNRPEGVTKRQCVLGFVLTLGTTALYGFIILLIVLSYKRTKPQIMCVLVMEMQFIISFSATIFSMVGMFINGEFQPLHKEAKEFGVGNIDYTMALLWSVVAWQLFYIGIFVVTSLPSSLLSGVIIAAMIPVSGSFVP